jgi:hypothetical protein
MVPPLNICKSVRFFGTDAFFVRTQQKNPLTTVDIFCFCGYITHTAFKEHIKSFNLIMPTISEFLGGLPMRTATEYKTTALYMQWWRKEKKQYPAFADYLGTLEIAHNTIAKHCRQAKTICKQCKLKYVIDPVQPVFKTPPKFTDSDFHSLLAGFANCAYPKFIISSERHFSVSTSPT